MRTGEGSNPPQKIFFTPGYLSRFTALRAEFFSKTYSNLLQMNNLLKVSALFLAVGLTSCEKKTETTTTTTTPAAGTESTTTVKKDSMATTAPAATGTDATATGTGATTAPAAGTAAPAGATTAPAAPAPKM